MKLGTAVIRGIAATAAFVGLATAIPAAAAAAPALQHCVVDVKTGTQSCFATEAEVHNRLSAQAWIPLVTLYDGVNYGAPSITLGHSSGPCTAGYGDIDYGDQNLGAWSNRVSSVKTFNRCDIKFYDGINYGPPSSVWIDSHSNLGAVGIGWSNRASSYKLS